MILKRRPSVIDSDFRELREKTQAAKPNDKSGPKRTTLYAVERVLAGWAVFKIEIGDLAISKTLAAFLRDEREADWLARELSGIND